MSTNIPRTDEAIIHGGERIWARPEGANATSDEWRDVGNGEITRTIPISFVYILVGIYMLIGRAAEK